MDFVKTTDLAFEYVQFSEKENKHEHIRALDGVDITIAKGEFVAILGHNGSGKSTFAKHLNALLIPSGGVVMVNGFDTKNEHDTWNIRQSAGMIFQNPDNQMIASVIEEDVAFGPENLGVDPAEIRARVDASLKTVGMYEHAKAAPHFLSGGQKQRVAIASVLAMKPQCIVLDEPTAMLDPVGRKEVIETIKRLNREEGITIILITHYMEETVDADRLVVMENGKVVMDATPKNIFKQIEEMRRLGLDVPQVTELADELSKKGIDIPTDIITIDEMADFVVAHQKRPYAPQQRAQKALAPKSQRAETVINVQNLTNIYARKSAFEKKAIDNISFTIQKGEFVGLIGHTGSGKSTLIQHLNALMKPTSGTITLFNEPIETARLKQIRQRVGLVFQYPEHPLFEMTVYKDVAFGPENMGLSKEEVDVRVREALAIVGIREKHFDKSPFELSGGQKRRVAIAGVLAMNPEILILDEPTAGLDPKGRDKILAQIQAMHEQLNITVILVSHSMEDIARLANKVIVINNGQLEFIGDPPSVFSQSKRLTEIGLAAPQISILMEKLNLPRDVYTVGGAVEILQEVLRV